MSQAAVAVEGERVGRSGDPCVMVIFGAAGDLTRRKLIPSLYNLAKYNLLSREFAVIGIARNPMSTDEFRAKLVQDLKEFVAACSSGLSDTSSTLPASLATRALTSGCTNFCRK